MVYYPLNYKPEWAPKSQQYLQYAEVYKDAVQALLNLYAKERPMHDYALAPILFLLRQYIELQLKGIIMHSKGATLRHHDVIKGHNIADHYNQAIKQV